MKLPRVNQFCCFDLRCGSLVIACSELAYAILGLIYGGRVAVEAFSESRLNEDGTRDLSFNFFNGLAGRKFGRISFWFNIAELVGILLIASLLVHGIRTKHRSFFIPWLGGHFLTTAVFGIFAVVVAVGSVVEYGTEIAETGFAMAAVCLLAFMINGYITTVVYSHFKQLEEEARALRLFAPLEVEVRAPYLEQLPPTYDEVVKNKEAYALMSNA